MGETEKAGATAAAPAPFEDILSGSRRANRSPPLLVQAPASGNLLLEPGLFDVVVEDGLSGPSDHRVGGHTTTETDALFRDTESVAPEGTALCHGAPEAGVLGDPGPVSFYESRSRHVFFPCPSYLNPANQSRIILVIHNNTIRAKTHARETCLHRMHHPPSGRILIPGPVSRPERAEGRQHAI